MIYDCFIFFNELDILEIRLEELYPVVDRFVIVEGSHTFQGQPKSHFIEDRWEDHPLFEKYGDKITGLWGADLSGNMTSWEREYKQRNYIGRVLRVFDIKDDDIVLLSDVDEIPRRRIIENIDPQPVSSLSMDMYYYSLNVASGQDWFAPKAARWSYAKTLNMQGLRTLDPPPNILYDAGWHFSYLGDANHIAEKFKAFAHTELNRPDTTNPDVLTERMSRLGDLWGDGHTYERVEIDETWPEAVKADRERWRKFEW